MGELLGAVFGSPSRPVADALHRRTGGNPFFLEELLVTAGRADRPALAALPLPWNLTEAVLRHLDGLDPAERRIVDAAAVLGQRISFDLLAAVTGTARTSSSPCCATWWPGTSWWRTSPTCSRSAMP